MVLSVKPLSQIESKIRLLVYGDVGTGKTTFAANSPNPVILDYENSTETLRKTHPDIPVIKSLRDLGNFERVLQFVQKPPDEYDTIIFDTVSTMNYRMLQYHMQNKVSGRDQHIALYQDFRKMTNVLREIFLALIDCPKNVIVCAHADFRIDDETNRVLEVRPTLPPKAREAIEQLINEVFYIEVDPGLKDIKRNFYVNPTKKIIAKNRRGISEIKLANPTWSEIYNAS